jgi:hypothetical protein
LGGIEKHYAMGCFGTNTFAKRYLDKPLTIAIFMNRDTLFENEITKKLDSLVIEHEKI